MVVIAVFDADPVFLSSMNEVLVNAGYDSVLASHSGHALALVRRRLPDLIFLELDLEHRGPGLRMLAELRTSGGGEHIPVIVLSADVRRLIHKAHLLRQLGAQTRAKPVNPTDLVTVQSVWAISN